MANISSIIDREGGYSNDPSDCGGETCWGITAQVARQYGYTGDMRFLPRGVAEKIYEQKYFIEPGFDKIEEPQVADKLLDMGVNCGTTFPVIALQRCLNGLNNQQKDYPDVRVDGKLGPSTLYSLSAYLKKRSGNGGRRTLLFMLAAQQSEYYLRIAEENPTNEKFLFGWQSQRALYDAIP